MFAPVADELDTWAARADRPVRHRLPNTSMRAVGILHKAKPAKIPPGERYWKTMTFGMTSMFAASSLSSKLLTLRRSSGRMDWTAIPGIDAAPFLALDAAVLAQD